MSQNVKTRPDEFSRGVGATPPEKSDRTVGSKPATATSFQGLAASLPRLLAPTLLLVLVVTFAVMSPNFLTASNLLGVVNQYALLLLAAIAMTVIVRSGGIDLSIGVAIDLAALTTAFLLYDGFVAWFSILFGVMTGIVVGAINAVLVVGLKIRPFMSTLSIWFIGAGVQLVATGGGSPIYLSDSRTPEDFQFLARGSVLGIGIPILTALLVLVSVWILLERSRWGRIVTIAGEQPRAVRIAGRRSSAALAGAWLVAGAIASVAGILLAARSQGFVVNGGQAYLLDAIGAVFIGATLSRTGRPTLAGTAIGVLIFGILANGMNLIGLSFHWQGLARGAVLLLILLLAARMSKGHILQRKT
ncbi:MAG: ABC transporter permease [Micrococcaceae bacterium]